MSAPLSPQVAYPGLSNNHLSSSSLDGGSFLPGQRNIMLVRCAGTGKTHLAVAIIASVVRAGAWGRD